MQMSEQTFYFLTIYFCNSAIWYGGYSSNHAQTYSDLKRRTVLSLYSVITLANARVRFGLKYIYAGCRYMSEHVTRWGYWNLKFREKIWYKIVYGQKLGFSFLLQFSKCDFWNLEEIWDRNRWPNFWGVKKKIVEKNPNTYAQKFFSNK